METTKVVIKGMFIVFALGLLITFFPRAEREDVNRDGVVDLTDVSIVMSAIDKE